MTDVSKELTVLLEGLAATMKGSSKTLPMDTPNMERDMKVFCVFALVFFVFNWGFRRIVVATVIKAFMPLIKGTALVKFEQSVMEAIFYGVFAIVGVFVLRSQPWVWPSSQWWDGFAEGGHEIMRSDLRCFYIMYVARYSQAALSVCLETRRKDFIEMMLHHIVTVIVIGVSYVQGWNRIGVVVMVLLDFADVPLHLAKCSKYTGEQKTAGPWQFLADRLFEVFAVTFFVTRLVMYGYVCWSAHIEATRFWPKGVPEWTCVACLYTLFFLQVYWFVLIMQVVVRLLGGRSVEDPRSDDEDNGGAGDNAKKEQKKRK